MKHQKILLKLKAHTNSEISKVIFHFLASQLFYPVKRSDRLYNTPSPILYSVKRSDVTP